MFNIHFWKTTDTDRKGVPMISVLITVYNRKDYVIRAVNSVLNQDLRRDKFEIIVSKNFIDQNIDDYLVKVNCTLIYDEQIGIGNRLKGLINASNGEILVFLEDDDLFHSSKLTYVLNKFCSHNVVFLHNEYVTIDDSDNVILGQPNSINNDRKITGSDMNFDVLKNLYNLKAFFCMSNISIRRSLGLDMIPYLSEVKITPDFFFFLYAINSSGTSLFTKELLSFWRHHDSTSVARGNFKNFMAKRKSFWSLVDSDVKAYRSFFRENEPVIKLLSFISVESTAHLSLLCDECKPRIKLVSHAFVRLLVFRDYISLKILTLAILEILFPNVFRRFYYMYLAK